MCSRCCDGTACRHDLAFPVTDLDAALLAPMPAGVPFDHACLSVDAASGPRPDDNAYRSGADGIVQHSLR